MLLSGATSSGGAVVRDFARAPDYAFATLSPDGSTASYVTELASHQIVYLVTLATGETVATLSVELPNERVHSCDWNDARFLLCGTFVTERRQHSLVDTGRLYSIDALQRRVRPLPAGARFLGPSRRPRHTLVQQDRDGRGFPAALEIDLLSGATHVSVQARAPIRAWLSDGRGEVRVGLGETNGRGSVYVRGTADHWERRIDQALTDPEAIGPLALGAGELELFALKHHLGRAAVFRVNLARNTSAELLVSDPLFDVAGPLVLDPRTRELLAVRYLKESPAIVLVAAAERSLYEWLDEMLPEAVNVVIARSSTTATMLVMSSSDTDPPSIYVVDAKARTRRLLGHQYPQLEDRPHAPMRAVMYRARDGQRIPSYLTVPASAASLRAAVVLPHSGPEARVVREFDPLVQFLVAQGYAVLQMNFRGSLGYGAGFAAAGVGQWGGVIHNDITDAARWLVEQEIASPDRLCILGASFGGYAALLGAAKESQWYACAVSFAGPSDLQALADRSQRMPDAHVWQQRLGEDRRALWQMSPIALTWRVETPILLLHGRRDAVVPVSHSRRMRRALKSAAKPHDYVEREDCDHHMTATSCRQAVFGAIERFLGESLVSGRGMPPSMQ